MRISDWSSDVCSSDLAGRQLLQRFRHLARARRTLRASGRGHQHRRPARRRVGLHQCGGDLFRRVQPPARMVPDPARAQLRTRRSEEHTSELQSLMRISYAVFCLKKKNIQQDMTEKSNIEQKDRMQRK